MIRRLREESPWHPDVDLCFLPQAVANIPRGTAFRLDHLHTLFGFPGCLIHAEIILAFSRAWRGSC